MKNTFWKNKKNKKTYKILEEAVDCPNIRVGVKVFIYQPIDKKESYFVREQEEFFQKFEKISQE